MEKQFIINKDQRQQLSNAWKQHAKTKMATAGDHVIYNLLRGLPLTRGFTEKKTDIQGNDAWFGYKQACAEAVRNACTVNPYEKYRDHGTWAKSVAMNDVHIAKRKEQFQTKFGLDIDSFGDLHTLLRSAIVEHARAREAV